MTMPWGSAEEPEAEITGEESVAVRVVSTDARPGKQIGTEFGRFRTLIVSPAVGAYSITPGAQRLLNRSLRRKRAHIVVNSGPGSAIGSGFTGTTVVQSGTIINPGAAGIIASINAATLLASAPIGTVWNVSWIASLQGTVAAADANNMEIVMPLGTVREVGVFPGVVGDYPQEQIQLTPASGNAISVVAIGASSGASAIYSAQITATPLIPSFPNDGIIVGGREEITGGQPAIPGQLGGYLQIGDNLRYESQAELWVCWPSTNGGQLVYVTICDEQWASAPDSAIREGR